MAAAAPAPTLLEQASAQLLPREAAGGRLALLALDPAAAEASAEALLRRAPGLDLRRFPGGRAGGSAVQAPWEALAAAELGEIAGAVVELRQPRGQLLEGTAEWLRQCSAEQLAHALDAYASLHDRWLADRLAAAVVHKRQQSGSCESLADLEEVLEALRPEWQESLPHLEAVQLLRAVHVAAVRHVEQLGSVLGAVFEALAPSGRCAVVTYNPWEADALNSFLHAHELPGSGISAAIPERRRRQLYPLLASGRAFIVRQVGEPIWEAVPEEVRLGGARSGRLHVLEKLPRPDAANVSSPLQADWASPVRTEDGVVEPPPAPAFGVAEPTLAVPGAGGIVAGGGASDVRAPLGRRAVAPAVHLEAATTDTPTPSAASTAGGQRPEWTDEELSRFEELKQAIAERRAELSNGGLSLKQLKRDAQMVELNNQLSALHHVGAEYTAKVERRCVGRVHIPVQLSESMEYLVQHADGSYADCTFGRGGHSRAILSKLSAAGRLQAFDVDPLAVQVGEALHKEDPRFQIIHRPFGDFASAIHEELDGVLMDLGVSSPQLDDRSRGFSIKGKKDGPLDLRMNQQVGVPASKWLESVTPGQLAWVLGATCYRLEPPIPERLAEALVQRQREQGPFSTTGQLVSALEEFGQELGHPHLRDVLTHPAFVAIRVFLNREMQQFEAALHGIFERLRFGGRCVVLCFNRWEMAMIRRFAREHEQPSEHARAALPAERLEELYPALGRGKSFWVRQAVRPVRPSAEELRRNQRAKSLMFVLEKVSR